MINSFSQYLVEEERVVYFTFGRMNPPTTGHGKLLDVLSKKAGRNPYRIYLSQTADKKKNPLSYSDKVKHTRKMFSKHGRSIMINKTVKTAIDAMTALYNEGFRKIVFVVGSDRVREFDILLNKYNGKKSRHGFYNFKSIDIISAGARDPDAEGVEGMSASKQRDNASKNDFTSFAQGLPRGMSNNDSRRLFNDVRTGLGLKEQSDFKRHVQLDRVSETREKFVSGNLFELGESVIVKKTDEVGTITVLGSNYVIVETADRKTRQWLDAVEKIEEEYKYTEGTPEAAAHARKMTPGQNEGLWANMHAKKARGEKMRKKGEKGAPTPDQIKRAQESQDSDIKDRPGTQPARYHTGLTKATKIARDRHFQKKKVGPAPGDATAKTKPSKHTTFVKKMMGENYGNWEHKEPVKYAKHLQKTFGSPDEITNTQLAWFNKDGFKRIVVKDEYILHSSPAPHYDFIYCYVDLQVPAKFGSILAESSGSIMIDYLKGEVGARCGSLTANATTLNYVMDVVSGRVVPSKKEYEKRILGMSKMFDSGKRYTTDWWPDETGDADPKSKYYAEGNHLNVCGCNLYETVQPTQADQVKKRVDREKEMDKKKHDRMMDRARTRDVKKINMQEYGGPPISRKDYMKKKNKGIGYNAVQEDSFADKSKASGISTGTLKKVYQRGVAAWKTGHRPGTTPQQWGHARVNAFISKKKKGGLNHDKDLA